jgi:hypothetical protein
MLLALVFVFFSACEKFFKDEFQVSEPSENRISIGFPGLVEFDIIQEISPDNRDITNAISNRYTIENELNRPITKLTFGLSIYDSEKRFEQNLKVAYVDSIRQTLQPFQRTQERTFNNSFDDSLNTGLIEIVILDQDVETNHPLSNYYIGEGISYKDNTISVIPYVVGTIDYRGDLRLRASGNTIDQFNVLGRVGTTGQFLGKLESANSEIIGYNLQNRDSSTVTLQGDSLIMTLTPSNPPTMAPDSIQFTLISY